MVNLCSGTGMKSGLAYPNIRSTFNAAFSSRANGVRTRQLATQIHGIKEYLKAVWDYLNMAFPPHLPTIRHVVINSSASNQLSYRTGISSTTIPNVMDFEHPPPPRTLTPVMSGRPWGSTRMSGSFCTADTGG